MALRCLFGLPSVTSCRNTQVEHGWTWYMCQRKDCLNLVICSGGLLWSSNSFLQCEMWSKTGQLSETPCFPQSWAKSYWHSSF
jgi:hypothetical protein